MTHLVVFDLDGTLIDSRRDLADSANELLAEFGAVPLSIDRVAAMVGDGARVLVERVLDAAGVGADPAQALARFLDIYERRLVVHTRPYPGLVETIAALDGRADLAVLTNKPIRHTRQLLDHFDLGRRFGWVVGGDSGLPRKPDPAGLRHLMRVAGVGPERTMYVGDSAVDAETAARAGTRLCAAAYGFGRIGADCADVPTVVVARTPEEVRVQVEAFLLIAT